MAKKPTKLEAMTARMNGFRSMATNLLSRAKISAQLGMTFDGDRDTYTILGYQTNLMFVDFLSMYNRHDIAGRIVDLPAQATWRKKIRICDIESNDDVENSEFEKAFNSMAKRLKLWHYVERADRISGIGRYGILVIGAPGPLDQEMPELSGPDEIMYLAPYAESSADIGERVVDPKSPRFGKPLFYNVDVNSDLLNEVGVKQGLARGVRGKTAITGGQAQTTIHHSRVIHFAENLGENDLYGVPRLQRVHNLMLDLMKVVGGSAETFWMAADKGMNINLDADAELSPDDAAALSDEVDEYQHGLRRWIRTRGAQVKELGGRNIDARGAFGPIVSLISGATGIPQRILIGSERGQLASVQDRRNWNERVGERQTTHAEPNVINPIVDTFIKYGALPEPKGGDYIVKWPDLLALGEEQRSLVAQRTAQALKSFAASTKEGVQVVSTGEFRERYLGLPAKTPELEMAQPTPPPQGYKEE